MDGLLVVDKPTGPTSHDVVARVRRLLRERRIGHTGTLDPMASGVLPLVVGRATRLARFLADDQKRYEAIVRLGVSTDTADAEGQAIGSPWLGAWPNEPSVQRALDRFRGTFLQQPPAFSAKKIGGERSYRLARRSSRAGGAVPAGIDDAPAAPPPLPDPVAVTCFEIGVTRFEADLVHLSLVCSPGFYVRSLAHDLGQALGVGAHLAALRRTATSGATLDDAVALDALESGRRAPSDVLIPMDRLLPHLPAVELTAAGLTRATRGQELAPTDATGGFPLPSALSGHYRLLDQTGALKGIAGPSDRPGLLHPAVILM